MKEIEQLAVYYPGQSTYDWYSITQKNIDKIEKEWDSSVYIVYFTNGSYIRFEGALGFKVTWSKG
jgi:hypothetical protein